MKKMEKIVLVSAFLLIPLVFLTGCSKVSLTGSTGTPAGGEMSAPPSGGTPPDGGTPPSDAPVGAPVN